MAPVIPILTLGSTAIAGQYLSKKFLRDEYRVLMHGLINSLLPETVDADKLAMNDALSEPTLKALTQFLDHHLGDVDVGTRRQFKYANVQEFFGGKPILIKDKDGTYKLDQGELSKQTPDQSLRTILGSFTVTRTEDGYDILDAYDFSQRPRSYYGKETNSEGKLLFPEWREDHTAMTLMDIAYRWSKQDSWIDYETIRSLAGNRLPEKKLKDDTREGLDPKTSSTMAINWQVPEGSNVASKKFQTQRKNSLTAITNIFQNLKREN
jgi:hypothetical protein